MPLKPWRNVVTPREDLREGKPLDAAEFAVHLDQVRDGRAHEDYQQPQRFFDRTYLTQNLTGFAAEVVRRLSGEKTETSAVFNLTTQFGGGKTHALTLLYHLAQHGPAAASWTGVKKILDRAGIGKVPQAATAVFVGTEFDSLTGRGGSAGEPLRKTPWGEIAYQLGGEEAFNVVAEHERQFIEPKGDVIRAMLPKDRPCLILMDEIINYVSTYRRMGYNNALYNFIQALSETARGMDNVVLVASIPASELEYTADDQADEQRFKKMLDRLGKAIMMSAEAETSEIIRRRLFEWDPQHVGQDGRILLDRDAQKTCNEYGEWVVEHRQQIPSWFPVDEAREAFLATYPFHPMVLSVFERKWRALPRFQQTRGILRLLALWVSKAYRESYEGAHRDPLIGLGTAPLDDPLFRSAVFEQLGETRLEGPVTTDVCGKADSHAVRLDKEAVDTIKKGRLHRKAGTAVFFESNGGQTRDEATLPEIRLACAEPGQDIGNVETVMEALSAACYFLAVEGNRYRFSLFPNLNKLLADRRASIQPAKIDERVRTEVQKVFAEGGGIERVYFPEKSGQIPNRAVLTLVVLPPECSVQEQTILQQVEAMIRECGSSSRTYKSALLFALAENDADLREAARNMLALEGIDDEKEGLRLDESQLKQLPTDLSKARRELRESVWRTYKNLILLGRDNSLRVIDLGLIHSSASETLTSLMVNRLRQEGEIEKEITPRFLIRNWPPAFSEWSTKAVRDAFSASPQFPRLLNADAIKETIARGATDGVLAYVGKAPEGGYSPFCFKQSLDAFEVEISEDMFIITAKEAEKHIKPPELTRIEVGPSSAHLKLGTKQTFTARGLDQFGRDIDPGKTTWTATGGDIDEDGVFLAGGDEGSFIVCAKAGKVSGTAEVSIAKTPEPKPPPPPPPPPPPKTLKWSGEISPQKWMNFYTKVLTRFVKDGALRVKVEFEVQPAEGVSEQRIEETRAALRELGLEEEIKTE